MLAPDGKRGNWRDRYWGEFCGTLVPLMQGWGFSLAGAWQTPIGAGHGNEFSVLWSVDGESAWAEHVRRMVGPTRDPGLRAWRSAASDYVEHSAGRLLVASPGHDLTVLGRRAAGERVEVMPAARPWLYEVEFTQFAPEGRDGHWREDYWPEFRERLFPTLGRLGLDLVGAWETAPGSGQADECVFLYRTRDFGTRSDQLRRFGNAERAGRAWRGRRCARHCCRRLALPGRRRLGMAAGLLERDPARRRPPAPPPAPASAAPVCDPVPRASRPARAILPLPRTRPVWRAPRLARASALRCWRAAPSAR